MATPIPGKTYQTGQNTGYTERNSQDMGVLDSLMPAFYSTARGHRPNKYLVYFYGPYVEEALHVMDRNSYADKYNLSEVKVFENTLDYYKKAQFDDWMSLCWDDGRKMLCMFWNALSVDVPGGKAKVEPFMIDSTKSMKYPLITKSEQPNAVKLSVLSDSYMMWFHFFNALYNVQFSPLVLKPRSTLQKINMYVNFYHEGITMGRSHDDRTFLGSNNESQPPVITDLQVGQMFEFNSCVLANAPQLKASYNASKQYEFSVDMHYPNPFQGSFKNKFRYLRDNTTKGVDAGDSMIKRSSAMSPYGEYNKGFYEASYRSWQGTKDSSIYEAYDPADYKEYMKTRPANFKEANKWSYDLHDEFRH